MLRAVGNEKHHAHELIEQLPPHQLSAVVGLLEAIIDPVSRKLAAAPMDDEPETEDERLLWSSPKDGCASTAAKASRMSKCYRTSI